MIFLKTILTSLLSIAVLFALTKLIGKRQISEMSLFDYINGITIGSIAADAAINESDNFYVSVTAMIVYGVFAFLFSFLECRSIKLRKFISGKPLLLFDNGKIYNKNLKKEKITIDDFQSQCRINGYFDFANIQTVFLEPNGKFSFIPSAENRPVTTSDISVDASQELYVINIIMDGKIMQDNLKKAGKDENWLRKQLEKQKIKKIDEIFLACCDSTGNLSVYKKQNHTVNDEPFE